MTSRAVAGLFHSDDVALSLSKNTQRFTTALRAARRPDAPAVGRWTVRDVARHTAWGTENYVRWAKGETQPDLDELRNMPQWNIEKVEEVAERDLIRLAERIERATAELVGYLSALKPTDLVPWYCGISLPANVSLAMRLIEVVLHGHDVAQANRQQWEIVREDALVVAYSGAYIAPFLVKPEEATFSASLEVRFRGGASLVFRLERGAVTVDVAVDEPAVDCRISADPRTWILTSSGRKSPVWASLSGGLITWGRKPWLPLKFRRLFVAA